MDRLKTLVVDDELGMRLGIQKALKTYRMTLPDIEGDIGFDVDAAESGEEAVAKILKSPPDILLLDYKLPDISGLEILEQVRPSAGDMTTVMITAYASLETAVTAIKQGAFDFLAKPFTPDELRKTVSKAAQSLMLARQVKKLAREKQQVRFQFISVLGHELKSPLNAVEGYLELMRDRSAGPALDDYAAMIDRSLIRIGGMRKLISDLLDLTRIESGQKRRELAVHDLRDLARAALETAAPAALEKNVAITLDAPESVSLECDSGEIEIVLNNLVSNAVKYNRPDGKVTVEMKKADGGVMIAVADTGIGMDEEEVARLFHEFVRIKNEKTKNIMGSGLGLAIVRKIAALYGGDVKVQSKPDEGTTFTVRLPPLHRS